MINVDFIIGDEDVFDNDVIAGMILPSQSKIVVDIVYEVSPIVNMDYVDCNNLAPGVVVHVVNALGILNTINQLVTDTILVTLFPHKVKFTLLLSPIGNPVPTILPSIPPFVPATLGVTDVIVNGTVIAEIELVSAYPT